MSTFIPIKTAEQLATYVPQLGPLQVRNPHICDMKEDVLYHIALGNKTHDLKDMFKDVKFVCFGGSPNRMQSFAKYMIKVLNYKLPAGQDLCDIAHGSDRYVLYKVGPVLSVSHGMGSPSLSIIFHEIYKLVHHAGCSDVVFFRIGTSGGLGLEPGSVVITDEAVDGLLRPYMEVATLGMLLQHPSRLTQEVAQELLSMADPENDFTTIIGKTMSTLDFYEGQARLDGAFCDYTEEDKMAFLKRIHNRGICNIEMESLCFAASCYRAGIKSAVVCVTLLDRLKGDQISTPHDVLEEWQKRPQRLIAAYIKKHLGIE
ncbi:hypothetical protein BaRGS_00035945 [Batillaria attramentaria]|uniref:Nucleoside phosphorylase domain-containing protein n=1 Tax=Batillaria attramentaria TaxID=370345 RepID=A0ABD0JD42_9CAEN